MVTTLLQQPTLQGTSPDGLPASVTVPDTISTETLEQYRQEAVQPENSSSIDVSTLHRDSPLLYVLDNRIIPHQIGLKDKVNPNIWLHPRDVADPAREPFLRTKLDPLLSLPYPSYHETELRKPFITALRTILSKDPALNDNPPPSPFPPPIAASAFNTPLSHIVNGQPFPELLSEAELELYKQANAIYLMLEYKLAKKNNASRAIELGDADAGGYPDLLRDTIVNLQRRGVSEPSMDQLIHELRDALGVTTTQFVRTASEYGAQGIAELLKIDQPLVDDIMQLMDYSKARSFPLNDVVNWEYGRELCPPATPVAEMITRGKEQRIIDTIEAYRTTLADFGTVPNQIKNERLLAKALDSVPSLLRELFFEEGGQIIFTQEPDLYNLIDKPATGFNLSYQSSEGISQSLNQMFISGDLGLPRTTRTIVHEIHHMLFPQYISPEEAMHADTLLNRDSVRLSIFKDIVDEYENAVTNEDVAGQTAAMQKLDSPEYAVGGKKFSEMLAGMDMDVFAGAVNEAYQYLQMEAPSYNRIGAYQQPEDRFREIWPRFGEISLVEYRDRPQIMQFIAPNIDESYKTIYLPHLQRRLDALHQERPSRADTLIYSLQNGTALDDTLYKGKTANLEPWQEHLFGGDVTIKHPAGDIRPVSFAGMEGTHPLVQNNDLKKPASLQQTEGAPLIVINPQHASLLNKVMDSAEQYDIGV